MLFLKLNFQDENQLYASFLAFILAIYRECLLYQFLSRDIQIHIPILRRSQNRRITS